MSDDLHQDFHGSPNFANVILALGQPRLKPYKEFFKCTSDRELIGSYLWGQAVAAAFQPTLGMYEVVLRNAIHLQASRFCSKEMSESDAWYDGRNPNALTMSQRTRDSVEEILSDKGGRLARLPAPDKVVAALSFGFWPALLVGLSKREQTHLLAKIFHAHPHSTMKHWGRSHNVQKLISELKSIQGFRNAVAHYEPIWKRNRLTGRETRWADSIISLREKHEEIIKITAWCCPSSASLIERSFAGRMVRSFCSNDAVLAFMRSPLESAHLQIFQKECVS